MFRRKPRAQPPAAESVGRPWLDGPPEASDIHVVYTRALDTGQQWRSLRTRRVFDVSFADALVSARVGDRAYLRFLGAAKVGFVRDPRFVYTQADPQAGV